MSMPNFIKTGQLVQNSMQDTHIWILTSLAYHFFMLGNWVKNKDNQFQETIFFMLSFPFRETSTGFSLFLNVTVFIDP